MTLLPGGGGAVTRAGGRARRHHHSEDHRRGQLHHLGLHDPGGAVQVDPWFTPGCPRVDPGLAPG